MSNEGVLTMPYMPGARHYKTYLKRGGAMPSAASPPDKQINVAGQPGVGFTSRPSFKLEGPSVLDAEVESAQSECEVFQPQDTPRSPSHSQESDAHAVFHVYESAAERLEKEKENKSSYENKVVDYKKADGTEATDTVLIRSEPKIGEKIRKWQDEKTSQAKIGFNKIGDFLRDKTGRPRKTGSRYGSSKGAGSFTQATQSANDCTSAALFNVRWANGGVGQGVESNHSSAGADLGLVADGLTVAAALPSGTDALLAGEAYLRLRSVPEKAKQDLRTYRHAAARFVKDAANATSQDAEGYLKFMEAGERLFGTTTEDSTTVEAARYRAIRSGMTAGTNAIGAGIAVSHWVGSINPVAAVATAPLAIVAGGIEVKESKKEFERRLDQQGRALERKGLMNDVLEEVLAEKGAEKAASDPDCQLLNGLVACFDQQQNRLLRQAKREKKLALLHGAKGGGSIGAAVGTVGGLAAMAATGVLTVATAGAALVAPLLVGAGWGVAVAYRGLKRMVADSNAKRRQRMMQAIALDTPRVELERKLVRNDEIEFAQEEGQYVAETGHFAGTYALKLKARDNEHLGLHVLALHVQDLARGGAYDEDAPLMRFLHRAVRIDKLGLLAMCKAAAGKEPDEQLDFIKARLALKLGIKFTVGATQTQAPPHPSIFVEHFRAAWDKVAPVVHLEDAEPLYPQNRYSSELYPGIREAMEKAYPDPQAGMRAFQQAIETFLQKSGDPQAEDMKMLKGFADYLAKPRQNFDDLVKKENEQKERVASRVKREADSLLHELEGRLKQRSADPMISAQA